MPMNKICKTCKQAFIWEDLDLKNFEKFGFESLDTCRQCLHMQRLSFRNERVFYRRKCDATQEDILSIYHPESPYKVYKADYFWSDKWNPLDYGQEFDFSRPFFDQFAELKLKVPRLAIHNAKSENSEYCNTAVGNKNCYMIFGGDMNEDSMFGVLCDRNRDSVDLDYSYKGELLYFCSDTANCYNCHYLFNAKVSSNCYFCEELSACSECILCFNLKNKNFCIENKQYSEEEYFAKKKQLINGSFESYKNLFERFLEMRKTVPKKFAHIVCSQDCEGDYIVDSKNCTLSFDVARSEDTRDIIYGSEIKDCFCCDMLGLKSELCFNNLSAIGAYRTCFSFWIVDSSELTYCDFLLNSSNCFGCVCLNHGEYCILNKKYSKEEYEDLLPRVVAHMKKTGEWGQFFPAKLSCFGYNETTAALYWPLTKEDALARGFNWRDEPEHHYQKQNYQVPDNIKDVGDDILNAVSECKACGRNFKIQKQELTWYKRQNVPIPDQCFNCRMKKRASMRNPRELWAGNCVECGANFKTSYDPALKQKLYCEKCYLQLVY